MSQGASVIPTTGTQSGLAIVQDMNAALNALLTQSSGSSAPTNGSAGGAPDKFQVWADTSVTPNALRQFDGTSWVVLGYLDATNHIWNPPIGGGVAAISSATTTDIWANPASTITVNGTATIAQFANADAVPGTIKLVKAGGAFTMTHDATKLVLPTGQPITVATGDSFFVFALSATNVQIMAYSKADGTSLQVSNRYIGELIDFTGSTAPALTVFPVGQTLSRTTYAALWAFAQAEITAGNTLYTVGNGSTTFGAPDKRGRVSVMPDPVGIRITGNTFNTTTSGGVGGIERISLGTSNLPPYTPTGSLSLTSLLTVGSNTFTGGGGSNVFVPNGAGNQGNQTAPVVTSGTFTGNAQGGSTVPFTNVQPSLVTNCLLFAGA